VRPRRIFFSLCKVASGNSFKKPTVIGGKLVNKHAVAGTGSRYPRYRILAFRTGGTGFF
jgi:hypothetical protein